MMNSKKTKARVLNCFSDHSANSTSHNKQNHASTLVLTSQTKNRDYEELLQVNNENHKQRKRVLSRWDMFLPTLSGSCWQSTSAGDHRIDNNTAATYMPNVHTQLADLTVAPIPEVKCSSRTSTRRCLCK